MKTFTASLICTASCLASSPASAVDTEREGPAVEISAYRIPVLESEAVQGVTVISNREIMERNPTSIADVLQSVPGLHVDTMGGPGGFTSVYIRGNDLEHTLVLIDGVRMNDPLLQRPGYDFSALDPNSIERIEVIRGAGSAIYGADAIGGVVNIVTRRVENAPFKGSGSLGLGTKGYATGNARIAGGIDGLGYSLGVGRVKDGRDSDGGELDLTTFDGSLRWQPISAAEVNFAVRLNDRESTAFPSASGGIRLAIVRTLERRDADENVYSGGVSYGLNDKVKLTAQASRFTHDENIVSPGVPSGFVPASDTRTELVRNVILLSGAFKLPMRTDLTLGFERQSEEGDSFSSQSLDFNLRRTSNAYFAAMKSIPLENLVLMFEVRHDRVGGQGNETSPGAGVRYDIPGSGTSLKARYSEGFRPPSFFSLANSFIGNPNLVSETSKGYEVGVEQVTAESFKAGVTLFKTDTRNLIEYDPNIGSFGRMVNRNDVTAKGAELQLSAQPVADLNVGASYTYVDTEINATGAELRNRPKHRASLILGYRIDEASRLHWSTTYASRSLDFAYDTGVIQVQAYTRSDISFSYRWKDVSFGAAIDNVFDKRYEEFIGFTDPGRRYRLSISATF